MSLHSGHITTPKDEIFLGETEPRHSAGFYVMGIEGNFPMPIPLLKEGTNKDLLRDYLPPLSTLSLN